MKKTLFLALFASFALICATAPNAYAQQANNQTAQQQQAQMIKPTFIVGDLAFAINTLNTVEIKAEENDAFLAIKNNLVAIYNNAAQAQKKIDDNIQFEISLSNAQGLINLLQRAQYAGANAERYKRIKDALIQAAKEALPQSSK